MLQTTEGSLQVVLQGSLDGASSSTCRKYVRLLLKIAFFFLEITSLLDNAEQQIANFEIY
jgi:hypothetical protein